MNNKLALLLPLFLPTASWAGDIDDNDFGTWLEVGAKKDLYYEGHEFSLEAGGELRTQNTSRNIDRLSIGLNGTYKMNKYLKFTLGYAFLDSYKMEKTKWKNGSDDDDWDKRKRISESHWAPRHRFYFEVSPDIKIAKVLRISLRERYQYTLSQANSYDRTSFYYRETGDELREMESKRKTETKNDATEHMHVLRSRLKFEYDKKRVDWNPYYSIEFHNSLRDQYGEKCMYLRKLRNVFGTDYKINRHHSIGMAYILTLEREPNEDVANTNVKSLIHALNVSYKYKF